MTKTQCKGLTPAQISPEIRDIFTAHIEIVGDPNLKWERLFRFMVMDNNRFPNDEPIVGICTDFFSALHAGEIERFGTTIEAHLRAFGAWFPRYWQHKTHRRAFDTLYDKSEPRGDTPERSQRPAWNLTQLSIGQIRQVIDTYDKMQMSERGMKVNGTDGFIQRCRESLRRYNEMNKGKFE